MLAGGLDVLGEFLALPGAQAPVPYDCDGDECKEDCGGDEEADRSDDGEAVDGQDGIDAGWSTRQLNEHPAM